MSVLADSETLNYVNQRGSDLQLVLHHMQPDSHSGSISGYFKTAVAEPHCKSVIGKSRPIVGVYVGNSISYTISYPTCQTTLVVTGNLGPEKNNLETLWIVSKQGMNTAGKDWNTRL